MSDNNDKAVLNKKKNIIIISILGAICFVLIIINMIVAGSFHTHTLEEVVLTEPDCTNTGMKYTYCKECEYGEQEEIRSEGHDWVSSYVIEEATCKKDGKGVYECTKCGDTEERTLYASHSFSNNECTKCGAKKSDIKADIWYEGSDVYYKSVYKYRCMNADVFSAASVSQGTGFMVSYYPVCKKCHITGTMPDMIGVTPSKPVTLSYYCSDCDEATAIKFEMD